MPVDERVPRTSERCSLHPGSPAVATCEGCGRPMCLSCAVPVRGAAYGAECLALALGEEPAAGGQVDGGRGRAPVVAFASALACTALPWTTFGEGAGFLGAWSRSPRWSMLSAVAALAGLILSALGAGRDRVPPRWDGAMVALGVAVAVGAILEWFRPPFPSRPSIVPWIAAVAGTVAALAAARSLWRDVSRRS